MAQIIEDGYGGNNEPKDTAYSLLEQAYYLLYELNNNTNDMNNYFKGVGQATQLVAEALDLLGEQNGR